MSSKYLIFIVALVLFTSVSSCSLNPQWTNTLDVTGPLYSGGGTEGLRFTLTEYSYDGLTDQQKTDKQKDDQTNACPGCRVLSPPSELVNCAGYVIDYLFSIGKTGAKADEVLNFCKMYGHELGWGDKLKFNDIVVYGDGAHVAIVTQNEGLFGEWFDLTPALIQGKDNFNTLFEYKPGQDASWGKPKYYRIEPDTLNTLRNSAKLGTWTIQYPNANPGPITCPRDETCDCPNNPTCDANPNYIVDKIVALPNGITDWNMKPKLNVVVKEKPPGDANAYGTGNKGDPRIIWRNYRATFSNDPNPEFRDYSDCDQKITVVCDAGQCCDGICVDTTTDEHCGGCAACETGESCIGGTCTSPAFATPQYLLHSTGHGTTNGPATDDWWFLYPKAPQNGFIELPDGYGGTITYSIDQSFGAFNTPREVCNAAGGETGDTSLKAWNSWDTPFSCKNMANPIMSYPQSSSQQSTLGGSSDQQSTTYGGLTVYKNPIPI